MIGLAVVLIYRTIAGGACPKGELDTPPIAHPQRNMRARIAALLTVSTALAALGRANAAPPPKRVQSEFAPHAPRQWLLLVRKAGVKGRWPRGRLTPCAHCACAPSTVRRPPPPPLPPNSSAAISSCTQLAAAVNAINTPT